MNNIMALITIMFGFVQISFAQIQAKNATEVYIFLCGSFFLIGLIIGVWLVCFISKNKIKSILKDNYNDYLIAKDNRSRHVFKYLRVVSFLKVRKDFYINENKKKSYSNNHKLIEFEDKIAKLEKEKEDLLKENIEFGEKFEKQRFVKQNTEEEDSFKFQNSSKEQSKQLSKIYFSIPENDGRFKIIDGEPSNDGKKYFKIEFTESSNIGELFYLSSERDQRAINQLEDFLKPVCDIENISNYTTSTKVELLRSGKVSLINGSWVVDPENKIRIKLY